MIQYWKANPWKNLYRRAQTRAKYDRNCRYWGMEFTITPADMKKIWERDCGHLLDRASIDRKDSTKGYTPDNVQVIELKENLRKAKRERKV